MSFDEFAERFRPVLENAADLEITRGMNHKALAQWDSLAAVSTLAMILTEYDCQISGDELHACEALGDLYELVKARTAADAG